MSLPKTLLAKRLGLARSTLYYRSKKREVDEVARTLIEEVMIGNPAYGHKRIANELGWNKKKVLRLMKKFDLKPKLRRGQYWQKKGDQSLVPASYPNLVTNWCPIASDVMWYADLTYLKVRDSFPYLATVIDGYTRDIIGFAISRRHNRQLVKAATLEAITSRGCLPRYFHSDQGSEYQSEEHLKLLENRGVKVSMSQKSSPWQNPFQESFYSQFKLELGNLNHLSEGEIVKRIYQQILLLQLPPDSHRSQDATQAVLPKSSEQRCLKDGVLAKTDKYFCFGCIVHIIYDAHYVRAVPF